MNRLLYALALVAVAGDAVAQKSEIPVLKMTVSPAAAPVPALKYRLLPELRDTTPGNAALLYYRAFSPEWSKTVHANKDLEAKLDDALQKSPVEVKAMSELAFIRDWPLVKEVDRGARRAYCDWELTPRVREEGIWLFIPDVQGTREFGRYLKIRAKLELADGQFAKAAYTFQTGLQLGRDITHGPTLIQALVGSAIAAITLNEIEEWIQTPEAPNLYWALTDLPQPFIDLRMAFQGEKLFLDNVLPGYREALIDPTKAPPPFSTESRRKLGEAMSVSAGEQTLYYIALAAKNYSAAKSFLREHGRTAEQVEALPALTAVMLYEVAMYDRLYDDMTKAQGLPYWIARPFLESIEPAIKQEVVRSGGPGMSLAGYFMPAALKVYSSQVNRDRQINLLRTVEALRMYAADHGRWPEKMADVSVPVPLDPFTGQPFEYRLDGDTAIVTSAPPGGQQPYVGNSQRYEIALRK